MFGSRILLGILIGVFVIPTILADPVGAFETFQGVVEKLSELAGVVGGVVNE